jgi:hypothetical protein
MKLLFVLAIVSHVLQMAAYLRGDEQQLYATRVAHRRMRIILIQRGYRQVLGKRAFRCLDSRDSE